MIKTENSNNNQIKRKHTYMTLTKNKSIRRQFIRFLCHSYICKAAAQTKLHMCKGVQKVLVQINEQCETREVYGPSIRYQASLDTCV